MGKWPSPEEAKVLKAVIDAGTTYGLEITKRASVPRGSVYVLLQRLEAKGLVRSWQEEYQPHVGIPRRWVQATPLGARCRELLDAFDKDPP